MKAKLYSNAVVIGLCAMLFVWALPARERVSQSVKDARTGAEQKVTRIPFEMNGNYIFIQGRVNDSEPLWFILDTGANTSVINAGRARELGLKIQEGFHATGAGGTIDSAIVRGISLNLGEVKINNLTVGVLPLNSLEDVTGRSLDVILGAELFKNFVVEVDYETSHLNLYEPKDFDYKGKGEILPLAFTHNHPYVKASIALPGREPIEGEFVVDLGSNFAVTLIPSFIEKNQILKSVPKTIRSRVRGVGGEVELPIGRINGLQLGRFHIDNPVTTLPSSGTFGAEGKAGNIGSAIMRRFKLIFDYSRQRMILEPNKNYSEPFEYDMSGLALVTNSPLFKSVRVQRVIDNSPASEAGIKPDDEIISVNGRPASEYRLMRLREMFREEGRVYELRLKRGDQEMTVKLKTRKLI